MKAPKPPRPVRWTAADGTPLVMRLARPSDAPQVRVSLEKLSPATRRNRFFAPMPHFSDELLQKFVDVDPAREHLLFVMRHQDGLDYPVAGGRFVIANDAFTGQPTHCDFSLIVGDAWQGQGIGRRIMHALIDQAIARGLQQMNGQILADNKPMLALAAALGFSLEADQEPGVMRASLVLPRPRRAAWKNLLPRW